MEAPSTKSCGIVKPALRIAGRQRDEKWHHTAAKKSRHLKADSGTQDCCSHFAFFMPRMNERSEEIGIRSCAGLWHKVIHSDRSNDHRTANPNYGHQTKNEYKMWMGFSAIVPAVVGPKRVKTEATRGLRRAIWRLRSRCGF